MTVPGQETQRVPPLRPLLARADGRAQRLRAGLDAERAHGAVQVQGQRPLSAVPAGRQQGGAGDGVGLRAIRPHPRQQEECVGPLVGSAAGAYGRIERDGVDLQHRLSKQKRSSALLIVVDARRRFANASAPYNRDIP